MSGYDALFGNGEAQTPEVIEQPQAAPEVQPESAPQPEPSGEPVSATPPAPENPVTPAPVAPAAPPAARNDEVRVPINALLSEREARKAAEARANELQRRHDEIARQEAETKAKLPDPLVDTDEFVRGLREEVHNQVSAVRTEAQRAIIAERVSYSEEKWTEKLGDEKWQAMNAWLREQPPQFKDHLKFQHDPYAAAHSSWIKATTIERLGDRDLDAWFEEQAAARGYAPASQVIAQPEAQPAPAQSPPPPPPQAPPRRAAPSLADVVGSTASSDMPLSGYDALFKR